MEFIKKCDSFLQVSMVLSALQAGNKGTQACITAASSVSGIIADLDTTIMFASAGTLNAENEESFADHRWDTTNTSRLNFFKILRDFEVTMKQAGVVFLFSDMIQVKWLVFVENEMDRWKLVVWPLDSQ